LASMGVLYWKDKLHQDTHEERISRISRIGHDEKVGEPEHDLNICDPEDASLWEMLAPPRWTTHIATASLIPPAFYLSGRILNEGFRGGFWYIMSLTPLLLNWTDVGRIGGYKIGSLLSVIGLFLTTASCLKVAGGDMGSFVLCGVLSNITPAYCLYNNFCKSSARVQDVLSSYSWVNFQAQWDELDTDKEGLSEEDVQKLVVQFVTNILDTFVEGWTFQGRERISNVYENMRPLIKDNVAKLVVTVLDEKRPGKIVDGKLVKPKMKKAEFLVIATDAIQDVPKYGALLAAKTTTVTGALEIARHFDSFGQ